MNPTGAAKVIFTEEDLSYFIANITDGRACIQIRARKGPINSPTLQGSTKSFRETYGLPLADTDSDQVVQRALDRGAVLYVNRVAHYTDPVDPTTLEAVAAALTLKNSADVDTLTLTASSEGTWGNTVLVTISENESDSERFDMSLVFPEQPDLNETFTALTMNNDDPRYAVTFINENSKLVVATDEDAGNPFDGDTVAVDGTTFTIGDDVPIDINNIDTMAESLAALVEALADVNATALSNVVTVEAATPGTAGNSITLAVTSAGSNIAISGSTLSGGAAAVAASSTITYGAPSNGDTLSVAGSTFTKAAAGSGTEFSTIGELTALINALATVNATDNGTTITVTAATPGAAGNAITIAKTGSALTLGNATGGHLNSGADAVAATGTITFDPTPTVIDNPADVGPVALTGGEDGGAVDDDDWIGDSAAGNGFHAFDDIDDALRLGCPEGSSGTVMTAGVAYCENRKDMIYIGETPPTVTNVEEALEFRKGTGSFTHAAFNSSYGTLYFGRPEVRSSKTNSIVNISNVGDVMAVHAYSAKVGEPWFAPAGLRRGKVPNALGIHYNVGTPGREEERNSLVNNQVNPIVDFANDGVVVFDQLTLQSVPSSLRFINVRMLLIIMRKALTQINRIDLFEPNDPATWRMVFNRIDPWLLDLMGRRAFYDYRIQCDQDAPSADKAVLNTPARLENGEFVCRIYIKPTLSIRFFMIEAVITKTSTNFQELIDINV